MLFQRVSSEPGLDRRATKRVDNDALRNTGLLEHLTSEEIADGREKPCVLFCDWLPVNGSRLDILFGTVGVGIGLYAEHANLMVLVIVNHFPILRIDALYGDIYV